MRKAFTLIELLVVIAIIAILAVVVVLTLNPAELLKQGRDSNRVSDMDTLTHALSIYQTDQGGATGYTMGNASSVYVSLPDTSPTCNSWSLPALPAGYTYQCASPQNYRNIDGTGWIPVNLASTTTGSPLGSLPIDPTNNSSTGLYYTYSANGSQFEITSLFESSKYKTQFAKSPLDPSYLEVNAKGSSLSVSPLFNPSGLVGYWPMDEGSGSSTQDLSGNGNNGTLACYGTGCSTTPVWTSGKVGSGALQFTGTTGSPGPGSVVKMTSGVSNLTRLTFTAWIYPTAVSNDQMFLTDENSYVNYFRISLSKLQFSVSVNGAQKIIGGNATLSNNNWYFAAATYDGNNMTLYLNGAQDKTVLVSSTVQDLAWLGGVMTIGAWIPADIRPFNGQMDDVRVYNRALSAAEIQTLYNAEK